MDRVEGLSPTLSIDQKTVNRNPRSTVGTVTEIYEHLRLLYARLSRTGGGTGGCAPVSTAGWWSWTAPSGPVRAGWAESLRSRRTTRKRARRAERVRGAAASHRGNEGWGTGRGGAGGRPPFGAPCYTSIIMRFTRITVDPRQMGGVPCIRGLRIPVASVVGLIAQGLTVAEVLDEHPDLVAEDVLQALGFAAAAVDERELPLLRAS